MSLKTVIFMLLTLGGLCPPSKASYVGCKLQDGCLGRVRIGDSISELERLVGRKIDLQFAGIGRTGLTLDAPNEIAKLGIKKLLKISVVGGVDIFFYNRSPSPVIEMISLGVPCEEVLGLRRQTEANGLPTSVAGRAGWRAENKNRSNKFAWGADTYPVCRFWLQGVVPHPNTVP